jgi:hypothetical protein
MDTQQELYQLLDAADKAGNQQDVNDILAAIQQFQSTPPPPAQMQLPPEPDMGVAHSAGIPQQGGSQSLVSKTLDFFNAPKMSPEMRSKVGGAAETYGDSALLGFGSEYQSLIDAMEKGDMGEYSTSLQDRVSRRKDFMEENPKSAIAASLAGGLTSGGVANPRNLLKLTGLGAVEGAGGMEENRLLGAGIGAPLAFGSGAALKAAGAIPKMRTGLRNLFPETLDGSDMSEKAVDKQARRTVAVLADRMNGLRDIPENANFSVMERLRGGTRLGEAISGQSDEGGRIVRESGIIERADGDVALERLAKATGLDDKQIDAALRTGDSLDKSRRAIGKRIEEQVAKTRNEPLDNQEKFAEFFELPGIRKSGVVQKAMDSLEDRGKKVLRDVNPDDPNAISVNEELAQEVSRELQGMIDSAKSTDLIPSNSADYSRLLDLRQQWQDLLEKSTTSKTLKKLRGDYRNIIRKQGALEKGLMGEGLDDSYRLAKVQGGQKGIEPKIFQKGVRTNLAAKNGLLGRLKDPDTMRRLKKILPDADINKFETAVKVENIISDTATSLKRGLDHLEGSVAPQTLGGKTQAKPESIIEALSGKRAYSPIGGVFLIGNEALEAINRTDLPDATVKRVAQLITQSGEDADKFVQELLRTDLPKYQKEKVFRTMRKTMLNAIGVGSAAAGTSSLQDAMSNR